MWFSSTTVPVVIDASLHVRMLRMQEAGCRTVREKAEIGDKNLNVTICTPPNSKKFSFSCLSWLKTILDTLNLPCHRSQIRPAAVDIIRRLNQNHYEAYIVGGAVRDAGARPDFDIATEATPEQVRQCSPGAVISSADASLPYVFSGRDTSTSRTFRRQPNAVERRPRRDDACPYLER